MADQEYIDSLEAQLKEVSISKDDKEKVIECFVAVGK